jgi:hypothetical protein
MARQTSTFTGWSGTSWVRCEFCELQLWLFCVFMYPCKWNVSSERTVNCRSISPSMADCRNQLQRWTLLARSSGCKECVDYCCLIGSRLQQLCCRSCIRLWHSSLLSYMFHWFSRCMFKSGSYINCSKFIHQIVNCLYAVNYFITKFTSKFSPTLSSISAFHTGVMQKYTLL